MITPFGLRHIGLLRDLQGDCMALDVKTPLLEEPATPLRAALRAYLLGSRSGLCTYVLRTADHGSHLRGFAQTKANRSGPAWTVLRLAPALDSSDDAGTIWYRLLLHLCIAAGESGVQRMFASLPEDHSGEEVLRQAGFANYCRDRIFWRASANGGILSPRIRPVLPADLWDVQRLYHKVTPQLVLMAEEPNGPRADASASWTVASDDEQAYVLYGQPGEVLGYTHITLGPRGAWLRLMVGHGAYGSAPEMLDHALAVLNGLPPRPVYCEVRQYQSSIQTVVEDKGFELASAHSLWVKHTTLRVREPKRKLVPALEKRAEVAPTISRSEAELEAR